MAVIRINQSHQTEKAPKVVHAGDEIRIEWAGAIISMPHAQAVQLERELQVAIHGQYTVAWKRLQSPPAADQVDPREIARYHSELEGEAS